MVKRWAVPVRAQEKRFQVERLGARLSGMLEATHPFTTTTLTRKDIVNHANESDHPITIISTISKLMTDPKDHSTAPLGPNTPLNSVES